MDNDKILNLINKYEIISFDIFDTLLIRPYINPYHIFKHIELHTGCKGFAHVRLQAEGIARRACKNNDKQDITLEDIYSNMPSQYRYMQKQELDFEEQLLKLRPDGFELYTNALNANKKIAIISDMYLPGNFLEKILKKNGIIKYDYLYISGERGKVKATGDLFKIFLSENNLYPKLILHIGDNIKSDIKGAKKSNISTYHLPKISEQFFNTKRYKYFKNIYGNNDNSLTISTVLALISEKYFYNNSLLNNKQSYYEDFGYCFAGPVYLGFINFIISEIKIKNIQQLIFVARDCYILKKIIDIYFNDLKTFYVYAQRILNAKCFLEWGDEHNSDVILQILKDANKCKIPKKFKNYTEKEIFLNEHLYLLKDFAEENKLEYANYLKSIGIKSDKKTAIIDSGAATFSAQNLLSKFIKDTVGIYTIAHEENAYKKGLNIVTYCPTKEIFQNVTNLIEFIMMAPEPPVVGIKDNKPVYINNINVVEEQRSLICKQLESGIMNFIQDYNQRFGEVILKQYNPEDINSFVKGFLLYMNDIDKKMFSNIRCSSNASHSEYKELLLTKIKKNLYKRKILTIFGIPILTISTNEYITKLKFIIFTVIKIIKSGYISKFYLLNLPLLTIKDTKKYKKGYLLNIFQIFKIKYKN